MPLRLKTSPSGRTPQWVVEEALEQQRQARMSPGERRREVRRTERAARRTARRWAKASRRRNRAWRATPAIGILLLLGLWFGPGLFDRFVLPLARPYLADAPAVPSGVEAAEGSSGDVAPGAGPSDRHWGQSLPHPEQESRAGLPPAGLEASSSPLGTPPVVPASDGYRFHESSDPRQDMVAYDPCRPVHYVVRPDNAPAGGQQLIEEAVAEVSAATGLQFVDDGVTSEAPQEQRDPYQPDRYGKRWAPVLITWSSDAEEQDLAGNVVGLGGSTTVRLEDAPSVYVTGQVALDAPGLVEMMRRPDGTAHVRAVIMHELGHVVGLDHVDDPQQLMHAESGAVTTFAAGDRAGLARLGAGQCVPQL